MFEFEIMVTGYTVLVVTSSVAISKVCFKKKLRKLQNIIHQLTNDSNKMKSEIDRLQKLNTLEKKPPN